MAIGNESISNGIDYPGKTKELRDEKKEQKDFVATKESNMDYNSIDIAMGKTAADSENNYNSAEASEIVVKPKSTFVDSENLPDQNENDIIDIVDKRLIEERARLSETDPYGYNDLIDKLVEPAMAKGDMKAVNNIIDRMSLFISDYQEVLKQNLPEKTEEELVNGIFKKTMGNIVLSSDGKVEAAELLHNFKHPRDAKPGTRKGDKIYYADEKSTKGFLSQEAADSDKISDNKRKKNFFNRVKGLFVNKNNVEKDNVEK